MALKVVIVPPNTVDPIELRLFFEQLCKWINAFDTGDEGALTPSEVLGTNKQIDVTDNDNGTITINISDDHLVGTANQITVTLEADNSVTLSLPQNIHTGATPTFVSAILSGLTASKPVWTNGGKQLISKDINLCDVVQTHIVATTQTVTTGTLTSGVVADTQVWADGNSVNVSEVTGVPGFDVRYTIPAVASFCALGVSAYYYPSTGHYCEFQIYDDTNTTWRVLWTFGPGEGFNYRYSNFPNNANMSDYINGSDEVLVRFYHPSSGNAAHDLYVDYVSIVGVST